MGRVFLNSGGSPSSPGVSAGGTNEFKEMTLLTGEVASRLRGLGYEALLVPDTLEGQDVIAWINARSRQGDVALQLKVDAFSNPSARGATCFYISGNSQRQSQADTVIQWMIRQVPTLPNRGAKPDTQTGAGRLAFCRDTIPPALVLTTGFLTNPDDRFLIQNQRSAMGLGIAQGINTWSRSLPGGGPSPSPTPTPTPSPTPSPSPSPSSSVHNVVINGQSFGQRGLVSGGNSYIPVDLLESLKVDLLVNQNVLYARVVDLQDLRFNLRWDSATRTLFLTNLN